MSSASLTGYENIDASPAAKGAHDEEVYLYDAASDALTCVSCDPSGARPAGVLDHSESGEGLGLLIDRRNVWGEVGEEHWLGGNIPGWTALSLTEAPLQPRYLNDEGRLFFNSPDELVPAAKNHEANVYEYEPSGVGTCESASGGCIALLSSGTSDRESAFLEATPSGSDVFFVTQSHLLPQDTETVFNIYDARVCTSGSPCQTVPQPPPAPCGTTEACRPSAPATIPAFGSGGSATVSATGNPPVQIAVKGERTSKSATRKALTRAQERTLALRACRAHYKHSRKKRIGCERRARTRYQRTHAKATHRRQARGR